MADGKFFGDETVRGWHEYHPPREHEVIAAHEEVRKRFGDLNVWLNNTLPEGPDKSVALRAVRDAMMQSNACLAVAGDVFRADVQFAVCKTCEGQVHRHPKPGSEWQHTNLKDDIHEITQIYWDGPSGTPPYATPSVTP